MAGAYGDRWWAPVALLAPLASLGFILIVVGADDATPLQAVGAALIAGYLVFGIAYVRRHRP